MAEFMTRVELHGEQAGDYDKLHEQMEARGFKRTVSLGETTFRMPDATYLSTGSHTPEQVYAAAQAAAVAIGRKAGVFVAQSTSNLQMWAGGLIPV
ncbi:DUF2622 domain-containing protein [Paraburkholderia sp. C35]|uniref:DUF2622 domain-containing protein n=1 Tax=Paraburkholderia sp. C35 TaxID=2126993 RepID=UPI000D689DF2|nr:DUF2622 domain-containing protein [Paraburkholderia sp. C35]